MNSLKYLLIFFALQLGAQETIRFSNGDKWLGEVKELNKENLSMKSELAIKSLPFNVTNLTSIGFKKNELPFKEKNTVYLTNGDSLVGNLLGMNEKQLTIDTTFAGVLILPRKTIKKIQYSAVRSYLQTAETLWPNKYSPDTGPLNLKAKYDFDHPTLIEATISGKAPSISISILGKSKTRKTSFQVLFYLRRYSNTSIRAGGYFYEKGQNKNTSKALAKLGENVKIQVYINPTKGLYMFYVNGQQVAEFDPGPEIENRTIKIYALNSNSRTLLERFTIAKWIGNKPIVQQNQFRKKNTANINLKNGDVAWGEIINISKEKLRFKSVLGDLSIPISSVSEVSLTNPAMTNSHNNFTLSRGSLRLSGDITLKGNILQVSNSYLSKVRLNKEHFWSLSRFVKPQKLNRRQKLLPTLWVGENVINGDIAKLKNGSFEVKSNNLIGKHQLSSQKLKTIDFTGSNNKYNRTVIVQSRRTGRKKSTQNWTIDLTNGDSFQTTQYSLKKDSLTIYLGELPLTLNRSQINRITLNQIQMRDKDFLQSLPDRYSLHFNISLSDEMLKMMNDNPINTYMLHISARSKTTMSYLFFTTKIQSAYSMQTVAGNRKTVLMPIKSHNKMILKNDNHFEIKFDHKKGLIEIWGNNQLIDSTGHGKPMGKFQYINRSSNTEIILNNKTVKPESTSKAIITSKYGVFRVEGLEMENKKLNFKYGQNQMLSLPFEQIIKIDFIEKP